MKTIFRTIAIVCFLSLITACGGAIDDATNTDDLSKKFDPIVAYPSVLKAASAYTTNISAVTLKGTRTATASKTKSSCTSFSWIWTVAGSDGIFVDVQVNASGTKVLAHEHRFFYAGQASFDPTRVLVNAQDLLAISADLETEQPTSLFLGSSLATEVTGPRWAAQFADATLTIDGVTGDVCK